jgi:hypothetical protein
MLSLFMFSSLAAQDLNSFRWKNRLLLLFTPDENNPVFQRQVGMLQKQTEAMEDRQLLAIFIAPDGDLEHTQQFTKAELSEYYYEHFGVDERLFTLILVGLDGTEKYRSIGRAIAPGLIFDRIDRMPMRQAELRRRKKGYGDGGSPQ